jgi:RNA polymerase sigma-70 factor (ECF subfamily)
MMKAKLKPDDKPPPGAARTVACGIADPDHLLVLGLQVGSRDAFEVLVEKYKQPIVNFASLILGDPIEAQDVAQSVFVKVFKQCRGFRFACRFSTWLYAITRNLCRNELRRRSRKQCALPGSEEIERSELARWQLAAGEHGSVPEVVFQRELQEKIDQALALLPQRERMAILLLRDEPLSYAEVAAILGTSQAATKTLIHRGRQTMKRNLRGYLQTGAGVVF